MSVVWMLSLSATGMPWSGPRSLPCARSRSSASASCSAFGIDGQRGVQPIFVDRQANQVLLDQLARGDLPLRHRRLHLRDRRLDDGEALLARGREREGRHQQRQGEEGPFHAGILVSDGHHFRTCLQSRGQRPARIGAAGDRRRCRARPEPRRRAAAPARQHARQRVQGRRAADLPRPHGPRPTTAARAPRAFTSCTTGTACRSRSTPTSSRSTCCTS